ncbi:MAG: hypothetical protein U0Y68_16645 [Blastocatellia bacterium]
MSAVVFWALSRRSRRLCGDGREGRFGAFYGRDYVLPAFQARGVFQSLIAARLQALRTLGIAYATGHSNEQSAFWALRFGFQAIFSYTIYQLDPPGQG